MGSLGFFFHLIHPTALRSIQLLTEMSTGEKGGRCVGLTTLPSSYVDCLEMWEPQHTGALTDCLGQKWDSFYSTITINVDKRMF